MRNQSEAPFVRPVDRMSDQTILDVLHSLNYRDKFLVWFLPQDHWEHWNSIPRFHTCERTGIGHFLLPDEKNAVVEDRPIIARVHQAFKGTNPAVLTVNPDTKYDRRCMHCIWHIEKLPS